MIDARLTVLALLLAASCGRAPDAADLESPTPNPGFVAEHEFGLIPHGARRSAELPIPVPEHGGPWIPVGFLRACSCAQHEYVVEAADGSTRIVAGNGLVDPADAVPAGGALRLRLTIDTREKEAADLDLSWTPGQVVLQEAGDSRRRELIPVRFSYGIEARIEVLHFAHLDLGDLPRGQRYAQKLELRPRAGLRVEFGEPRCVEAAAGALRPAADIEARLTPRASGAIALEVSIVPDAERIDGPFAAEVLIATDLPDDYVLRVPLSGTIVPTLRVAAPGFLSFGAIPFDEPREIHVLVTDHDTSRPADFHVVGIVDPQGADLTERFSARVAPVAEQPRSRSVHLRYLGGAEARSFRGEVLLAREPDGPSSLRIRFSGFDRR